jgi:hypothetical protein
LKNIYGMSNLGSGWGSYASEKISVWGPELSVCTSGPRLELPVETGTSSGWRRKAQFCTKIINRYFWSETETSGGDRNFRWSLTGTSVGVYSKSNPQILNWSVSRSVLGCGKLRK